MSFFQEGCRTALLILVLRQKSKKPYEVVFKTKS